MAGKTTSQAKKMMIKFLEHTREQSEFSFKIKGTSEDAEKFVHRMRVELSRMRDIVKSSGRVPKEFKMLTDEIEHDTMEGITVVKLKRVEGKTIQIAEDVEKIFNDIAGGEIIQ